MIQIILGSKSDAEFGKAISSKLKKFGVAADTKIASAHKTPARLLQVMKEAEEKNPEVVYITVAGRSNGLSGVVAGNTTKPVIACPPFKSDCEYTIDIHSTLRMPSDVCPMTVLKPENAALAAAKIVALSDEKVRATLTGYMRKLQENAS